MERKIQYRNKRNTITQGKCGPSLTIKRLETLAARINLAEGDPALKLTVKMETFLLKTNCIHDTAIIYHFLKTLKNKT
jgi:hypothetical protein